MRLIGSSEHIVNKTPSPLRRAIWAKDADSLFRTLDNGADINELDDFGESPLSEAIIDFADHPCRRQIVEEMLRRGANPKILDTEKCGPLMQTAIIKDAAIMRILLEAGADPNREFGCAGALSLFDWALSDYRYDEDLLNPPDEPTAQEEETTDGWLSYIERMALKYGKRPPDYVRVLREFGAKSNWELEEDAKNMGLPSPIKFEPAPPPP